MGRLFGTDGARGVANSEISCELAMNIGRAAALVLTLLAVWSAVVLALVYGVLRNIPAFSFLAPTLI